jgi:hypothetical protein
MLVCSVSLKARRAVITAGIAEATTATDASATGQLVLATLVDDPASASERLDAFLGPIMREAASATATVNAGLVFTTRVDEAALAATLLSASMPLTASVAEAANASEAEDATKISSVVTWNPLDKAAAVTLSNSDLSAQGTSGTGSIAVRATTSRASGKYYFEVRLTVSLQNVGPGIALATANVANSSTIVGECLANLSNGAVFVNSTVNQGSVGTYAVNDTCCVAVDLTNQKIWFRKNAGNWDNNVAHDPATNAGGFGISFRSSNPVFPLALFSGSTTSVLTANFGGTAFAQTPPAGFSAWQ